jgi:hypothetical protein
LLQSRTLAKAQGRHTHECCNETVKRNFPVEVILEVAKSDDRLSF